MGSPGKSRAEPPGERFIWKVRERRCRRGAERPGEAQPLPEAPAASSPTATRGHAGHTQTEPPGAREPGAFHAGHTQTEPRGRGNRAPAHQPHQPQGQGSTAPLPTPPAQPGPRNAFRGRAGGRRGHRVSQSTRKAVCPTYTDTCHPLNHPVRQTPNSPYSRFSDGKRDGEATYQSAEPGVWARGWSQRPCWEGLPVHGGVRAEAWELQGCPGN